MSIQYVRRDFQTELDPESLDLLGLRGPPDTQKNAPPAATGQGVECIKVCDDFTNEYSGEPAKRKETVVTPPSEAEMLDAARRLIAAGVAVHWLHPRSKRPAAGDDWSSAPVHTIETLTAAYRRNNNIGIRPGEHSRVAGGYLHLIDLDIRDAAQADGAWAALRERWPEARSAPFVVSGSGGESRHLYFVTDKPFRSKKLAKSVGYSMVFDARLGREVKKHDWEVELFGAPKQAVLPPSIHPDTGERYIWGREIDFDLLELGVGPIIPSDVVASWGVGRSVTIADDDDDDLMSVYRSAPLGMTEAEIETTIADLPTDWVEERDTWVQVGAALHHEFAGAASGFDHWCEWARQSEKYDAKDSAAVWKSFGKNAAATRDPVTMRTLIKAAATNRQASSDGFDDVEDLLADEPSTPLAAPCVSDPTTARLNKRHAVVSIRGRTLITTELDDGAIGFGTPGDLHSYYENDRIRISEGETKSEPVSKRWMRNKGRRSYPDGVTFAPGGCSAGMLNLWRGWAVEPDPTASCALFLDHVRKVVCRGNAEHAAYVIGWLAHMVQRPGEKPGVGLVLRGGKGAGKDTVADYVAQMIGRRHAPTVAEADHVTGKFNARLEAALLLHVQEGLWAGDRKAESTLKYMVTSERVEIERKGIDSINLPSVLRLFISANAEWVVPASADERRWAVFEVSDGRRGDAAYFAALRAEMHGRGPAALLHYLRAYDLTGFNVRAAPETDGLRNQKLASLRNVSAWWFETLNSGALPTDGFDDDNWAAEARTISRGALRGAYVEWMKARRFDGQAVAERQFGKELREMLPGLADTRPTVQGSRVWHYTLPALPDCRDAFDTWIGSPVEWEADQ